MINDKNITIVDNIDVDEFVLNVFVEISKGSNIKYEYDKEKKCIVCDRILHTPFAYPFNYGFIPQTYSPDSDPIDAVIIMNESLIPGSMIKCKLIGCLETSDSEGNDPKLLLCPIKKVDPKFKEINDVIDVSPFILEQIKYFFTHYKDLENKKVQIGQFISKKSAIEIYNESVIAFQNKNK